MISCLNLGLTLDDLDKLTIGQIIDIITQYNNIIDDKPSGTVRKATQADFDRF